MSQVREMRVGRLFSQGFLYNLVICPRRNPVLATSPAEGTARGAGRALKRNESISLEMLVPSSPVCLSLLAIPEEGG